MALNKLELQLLHTDPSFIERFVELFAISEFYRSAIFKPDLAAAGTFAMAVVPTTVGKRRIEAVATELEIPEADIRLGLLLSPYHIEIEVDLEQTNFTELWSQLSADLIGRQIAHPWVFGRCLYDRFFDMFPTRTSSLNPDETCRLIEGTPFGVFQIGNRVVGPFGVLLSDEKRYLYPAKTAPLWHCSDPSCTAIHPVEFNSPTSKARLAVSALSKIRSAEGGQSEWFGFYRQIVEPYAWYDHLNPASLPWLLGSGFSEDEQRAIFTEVLRSVDLRCRLPTSKRFRNLLSGSADQVACRLGPDFLLQALLLVNDKTLIHSVESVIAASSVVVTATEVRRPPMQYSRRGWFRVTAECSNLGVRLFSPREGFALRNLRAAVCAVYASGNEKEELSWKLRHCNGDNLYERLDRYLRRKDPEHIIKDLFLDSPVHLTRLFEALRYGKLDLPTTELDERALISKIIWKLGFKPRVYPNAHRRLGTHLSSMRSALKEGQESQVERKDRIRSIGVNLFVSLEEILDYSLAVACWALIADHYRVPRFTFRLERARTLVAEVLNASAANTTPVIFDPGGKNTLYALVMGFDLLAKELTVLLPTASNYQRRDDVPGHSASTVDPFPLNHTRSLFDLAPADVSVAIDAMMRITRELTRADAINIRNRLDHQRLDFPTDGELAAVCDNVEQIVNYLETSGVFSPPSVDVGVETDAYGRGSVSYADYAGRNGAVSIPPLYRILPTSPGPMILLTGLRFADSSEFLRLNLRETSAYSSLWEGYPRRRLRARVEGMEEA